MPTQIPLTTDPESIFRIKLQDRQIDFNVKYNTRKQTWSADLNENGKTLTNGLTLVLGTEILQAYNLGIGGLVMVDSSNQHVEADQDNLGDSVLLLHYTESELAGVFISG